jgi:hypothetical protein
VGTWNRSFCPVCTYKGFSHSRFAPLFGQKVVLLPLVMWFFNTRKNQRSLPNVFKKRGLGILALFTFWILGIQKRGKWDWGWFFPKALCHFEEGQRMGEKHPFCKKCLFGKKGHLTTKSKSAKTTL